MKQRFVVVIALLLFAAAPAFPMAARFGPDIQGVCTKNLTVNGDAAGSVTIRTASEDEPGASASFRSYGWSPWPRFTGSVSSVHHYSEKTRAKVSVGRNTGTAWVPYYVYSTLTNWCDD